MARISTQRTAAAVSPDRGRRLSAAAISEALDIQRRILEATGRWLRVGDVLLLRGDLSPQGVQDLRGSALFPADGRDLPAAELYGEIALRRGLITPEQLLACVEAQAEDRRAKRKHRLLGSILVELGHIKQGDLAPCEEDLKRDLKLHADEAKRLKDESGEKSGEKAVTPIDAQYLRAARAGELPSEEVVSALGKARRFEKVLGRRVALWEYLVVAGVVDLQVHKKLLDQHCNIKSASFGSWMLGGIIVELGYATAEEVSDAISARAADARRTAASAAGGAAKPRRLGEILIERKVITASELEEALRIQAFRRRSAKSKVGTVSRLAGSRLRLLVLLLVVAAVVVGVLVIRPVLEERGALAVLKDRGAGLVGRLAAAERLGELALSSGSAEKAVAALAGVARDEASPPELRAACLRALARAPGRAVDAALVKAAADGHPEPRTVAAWALGDRPARGPAAVVGGTDAPAKAALRVLLADPEEAVRIAAARSLAALGEVDGREVLVNALGPDSRPAFRRLGSDLQRPELEARGLVVSALEALSGFKLGDRHDRWLAWLALEPVADELCGRQRGPSVVARFAVLLGSERVAVRFGAARALAHLGERRGALLLARALDREDSALRATLYEERGIDVTALASEIADVLSLLTGQSFGTDSAAWVAWLEAAEGRGPKAAAAGTGTVEPHGTDGGAERGEAPGGGS